MEEIERAQADPTAIGTALTERAGKARAKAMEIKELFARAELTQNVYAMRIMDHLIGVFGSVDRLSEICAAEREGRDGCEYCRDGENLAYGHDSMQRTGMIYIDGNLLTADLFSESMAVPIFYCPVCGRKLKTEKGADNAKVD